MKKPILNFLCHFILQRLLSHTFLPTYHGMHHLSSNGPRSHHLAPLAGSVIIARKHNVIKYSLYMRYVNDCKLGAEFMNDYKAFLLDNVTKSQVIIKYRSKAA